jgi:hypothetical protein
VKVWRLYRFYDAVGRLLYIGQTWRPLARLIEHLEEQQWAHEIARWDVDPRSWTSEAEVLAVEEEAIRAERPLRNWVHNEGNPDRAWQPKVRSYRHPGRRTVAAPDRWRRLLGSPWTWWLAGWLATTVAALSAVTWAVDKADQVLTFRERGLTAVVLASVAVGWLWWRTQGRRRWRRWKRRR